MVDESREKGLDEVFREPFSITNILKNWYENRYGKNAHAKNLYAWAKANNRIITRFNPISQYKCRVFTSGVNYRPFEVEITENNKSKGFHVAIKYSVLEVYPVDKEIKLDELVFDKAFRFENGKIVELT